MVKKLLMIMLCWSGFCCVKPAQVPDNGVAFECKSRDIPTKSWHGGPSCIETTVWLDIAKRDWKRYTGFECDISGITDIEFTKTAVLGKLYGAYWPAQKNIKVWHNEEDPAMTHLILKHEVGHHCAKQQTRFPQGEAYDHCIMKASGYVPASSTQIEECLGMLFPGYGTAKEEPADG